MNDIVTINKSNYAEMAKIMGTAKSGSSDNKRIPMLPRLRIFNQPVKGQAEVGGRMANVELIEAGSFRLEVPSDTGNPTYLYSKTAKIRPFLTRLMLRRWVPFKNPKPGESKGTFHKTIMSDTLDIDLKDNTGNFNCGKPSGYIQDFNALPKNMQELLRLIKRVRVIFGTVELLEPVMSDDGTELEVKSYPFIWEIENKDAFKTFNAAFNDLADKNRLPIDHYISMDLTSNSLPNGNVFFTPNVSIDYDNVIEVKDEDHTTLNHFWEWVQMHNNDINNKWEAAVAEKKEKQVSEEDMNLVEDFVDVDVEEVA